MLVCSLGFTTDLMIRRLAGSEIDDRGDYVIVRTPSNPTFWWGNFIVAGADFGNAERWLETFVQAHPNAGHVAIGLDAPPAAPDLLEGYSAAGLESDISTVLVASELASPVAAPGVTCRALAGDADWEQALDLMMVVNEVTEPAEAEFVERKLREWQALTAAGHGAWFGAFVDGRLRCSLGLLTDGAGVGRYQSVETHPEYRRRGLARALIASAAAVAQTDFGVRSVVIVADPDYHATTLYRSLGFLDRDSQIQLARSLTANER